jgi:gluconolactonase
MLHGEHRLVGSHRRLLAGLVLVCTACAGAGPPPEPELVHDEVGSIERADPALDAVVAPDARIEVLARGFALPEGPAWDARGSQLLFSDVARDVIHRWHAVEGLSVFRRGAGDTGHHHAQAALPGANGLAFDPQGRLVVCEHGNRQVARLRRDGRLAALATHFEGRRLNSPNDVVVHPNGDVYFTDPPWGLRHFGASQERELPFAGVFRVRAEGAVELVARDLEPNGIALSPDARLLYVSHRRSLVAIELGADGTIGARRSVFTAHAARLETGPLDGLAVDRAGRLFVACAQGVLVLAPDGRHLGTLHTGAPASNCEIGEDGRSLFVTAGDFLARIPLAP